VRACVCVCVCVGVNFVLELDYIICKDAPVVGAVCHVMLFSVLFGGTVVQGVPFVLGVVWGKGNEKKGGGEEDSIGLLFY